MEQNIAAARSGDDASILDAVEGLDVSTDKQDG
jgi:hypothetical protein